MSTLDWLNVSFDGVHSFSWGLVGNRDRRSLRASDLLMDQSLQHLILLSTNDSSHPSVADTEVIRLRACLPYMLHEEWYAKNTIVELAEMDDGGKSTDATFTIDSDKTVCDFCDGDNDDERTKLEAKRPNEKAKEGGRLSLLKALASVSSHNNGLFPEAQSFLLEEILPHWDGFDRMGLCICYDLLPMLTPCSFPELQSKVLRYVEPLFTYGSPRIQHVIASGTLKGLLQRWGRLDWAGAFQSLTRNNRRSGQEDNPTTWKLRTLREFIKWVESLFLKAHLSNDGHELLRLAVIDFFETVASLSMSGYFLASPSPAIVYRLLLSQSALSVDRVCSLLLSFRSVFQRIKAQGGIDSDETRASDQ